MRDKATLFSRHATYSCRPPFSSWRTLPSLTKEGELDRGRRTEGVPWETGAILRTDDVDMGARLGSVLNGAGNVVEGEDETIYRPLLSWPSDHNFFFLSCCFFTTSRRTMTALLIDKRDTRRYPRFFRARARAHAHAQCRCDGSLTKAKWRNVHVGLQREEGEEGKYVMAEQFRIHQTQFIIYYPISEGSEGGYPIDFPESLGTLPISHPFLPRSTFLYYFICLYIVE